MNEAIQRFVDELAADPAVRGVILFGSHARGNARPDSDADLVILVERDQFEMGFDERDGQKFELLRWSEAVAIRYATDNPDNAADFWQVAEILHDPDASTRACTVCSPRSTRTARRSPTSWRSPGRCSR
jgi:predicted nucleotidyltransferase